MAESAVLDLEAAAAAAAVVGTGRLHKAVTEAGPKRKVIISYFDGGEVRCSSTSTSGLDEPCHCCCSTHGNGSTDIDKEASEFSDLEEESNDISAFTYGLEICRERREETIAESFDLKATNGNSSSSLYNNEDNNNEAKLSASDTTTTQQELENPAGDDDDDDVNSRRRRPKKAKMPSNAELEDFFSVTENDLMRQFTQRYNFDFVKEEPFEGRYEWVPVQVSHDEHVV